MITKKKMFCQELHILSFVFLSQSVKETKINPKKEKIISNNLFAIFNPLTFNIRF